MLMIFYDLLLFSFCWNVQTGIGVVEVRIADLYFLIQFWFGVFLYFDLWLSYSLIFSFDFWFLQMVKRELEWRKSALQICVFPPQSLRPLRRIQLIMMMTTMMMIIMMIIRTTVMIILWVLICKQKITSSLNNMKKLAQVQTGWKLSGRHLEVCAKVLGGDHL